MMKIQWKMLVVLGMVAFFCPLVLTRFLSGRQSVEIEKSVDVETFLPVLLCQTIPWDYEDEMLKAQAVLERSSLYVSIKNGEKDLWNSQMDAYYELSQKENFQKVYEKMKWAAEETRGQVLGYDGDICRGIYHKVSAGKTREGKDIFQTEDLKYLHAVESSVDLQYENVTESFYFTIDAWKQRMKEQYSDLVFGKENVSEELYIIDRDTSGYVMSVQVGNLTVSGEEFRKILDLTSSHFEIQFLDGSIRFLCNGIGHGFGLSQYGGNAMAKQGSTYLEILEYYFPGVKIY